MIIQYASDLHLEFAQNKLFLAKNPLIPKADILLLAGDIVPFAVMNKHADFFSYVSDNFAKTYWIAGNHEYYHFDAARKCGTFCEKIRDNVFLLNNTAIQHEAVRFLFSTLWSSIKPAHEWEIERSLNDFQVIKYNGFRFSAVQYNLFHAESRLFLEQELQDNQAGKTVVVTHHVPTFLHYPEKYKGDTLNEAFAVEMFDLIEPSTIDAWIYGHHHQNTPDFLIGKTQMLTNQLGYVGYNEHLLFNPAKSIEL